MMHGVTLACGVVLLGVALAEAGARCPIVPTPKVYEETGTTAELLAPGAVAIAVGAKATEPEHYAAERFQGLVSRRFGRKLPIHEETKLDPAVRQVVLLGQRSTNAWLDRLCTAGKIELSATSPGHDGFVIGVLADGERQVVLVGGSNARGVVYGQDAFFDLLRSEGGKVVFPAARVRDWPSIPWRGRPISRPEVQVRAGTFDAYVRSRLNWVDLRDGPRPRRGQFGYPPGFAVNEPQVRQIVAEAHRRGFFVYATVFCGVRPEQFDPVVRKFEELIALGADGLWLSFDDPGPGQDTTGLIERVLALGKRHGMAGREIATVPPTGSYQHIETDFNRGAAAVAGFEQATWLFTRVPCEADVAAARRIGLKRLPGWWHNWPRTTGGFTHLSYGGSSLRTDGAAYLDMPPLRVGWHTPEYEKLRRGHEQTDTVMLWGGWPEEYVTGSLGIWAWDPARHDWERTRGAVYAYVFGPAQAEAARGFDDRLARLKSLFLLPERSTRANWPCRLKSLESRPAALALVEEMDGLVKTLEAGSPKASMLDAERLTSLFLEPMRATVRIAKAMAEIDFPDYQYQADGVRGRMLELVRAGKREEAERMLAQVRERVLPALESIPKALPGLKGIKEYLALWREQTRGLAYWDKVIEQRKAEATRRETARRKAIETMPERFKQLVQRDLGGLVGAIGRPPEGTPLVEVGADDWRWAADPPSWRGLFALGVTQVGERKLLAVAFPGRTPSQVGDFAQATAELPTPKFAGKLLVHAFINDTLVTDRWTRYRFMQLHVNGKLVWEEDIALSREGKEWVVADITAVAKGAERLVLRFRVVDKRSVGNYTTVTVLGPVRLCAAP